MKKIPLTLGKFALVDDEDFEYLSQWKWCFDRRYATTWNSGKMTRMHVFLFRRPKGMQVDHINGDKIDNRKCNLRIVTNSQNSQNRGARSDNTSGYKGVRSQRGKWRAEIKVNYQTINLGCYSTKEQAARAYDEAARKYFGEFARLNFPNDS